MTALYITGFVLFVVAVIALLGLTPEQVNNDVSLFFDKQETLKDKALTARGKKKKSKILSEIERMRRALQETGKEKQFSLACTAAMLDTNSYGRSDGMRGNFSTNFQVAGRELLTPDEVRMLDNKYAIVFIRGDKPIVDFKYNIFTHPNVHLGADGGAEPYTHIIPALEDVTGIEIVNIADYKGKKLEDFPKAEEYFADIYAYDDEETEALCDYLEKKKEKREENTE